MKEGTGFFLISHCSRGAAEKPIHGLLRVQRMGFGGWNPKNQRKGSHRNVHAFSKERAAGDGTSDRCPESKWATVYRKAPIVHLCHVQWNLSRNPV